MSDNKREFKYVLRNQIDCSIMPGREYDEKLLERIRQDGVQQPLIVRPVVRGGVIKDRYELIDGEMRWKALGYNDLVLVDIRYGLKGADVYRISNATFQRKPRTTYERARLYSRWVARVKYEEGKGRLQAKVAERAHLSEGQLSQYLSIAQMFEKLEHTTGSAALDFNALKNQGINKLYELSRLTGHSEELLKVARQLSERPEMSVRELRQIVKQAEGKGIPDYARLMRLEGTEVDPPDVEKRILDLAREAEGLVEETRKNLQNFELSVKNASKEYSKKKTLAELEKLQRRLRRFHKDIGKLSGYLRPEKGPSD